MPRSATVEELIQLAIQAERATEKLYRRLTRMFTHVVEIAQFIERFAAEESGHVIWLENLRSQLTPEKLAAPAIPMMYQDVLRSSQMQVGDQLEGIDTLEDAYHLMVEIVNGEANQLLHALIQTYYEDQTTRVFLIDHLRMHMERISVAFPPAYASRDARLIVKAVRQDSE